MRSCYLCDGKDHAAGREPEKLEEEAQLAKLEEDGGKGLNAAEEDWNEWKGPVTWHRPSIAQRKAQETMRAKQEGWNEGHAPPSRGALDTMRGAAVINPEKVWGIGSICPGKCWAVGGICCISIGCDMGCIGIRIDCGCTSCIGICICIIMG